MLTSAKESVHITLYDFQISTRMQVGFQYTSYILIIFILYTLSSSIIQINAGWSDRFYKMPSSIYRKPVRRNFQSRWSNHQEIWFLPPVSTGDISGRTQLAPAHPQTQRKHHDAVETRLSDCPGPRNVSPSRKDGNHSGAERKRQSATRPWTRWWRNCVWRHVQWFSNRVILKSESKSNTVYVTVKFQAQLLQCMYVRRVKTEKMRMCVISMYICAKPQTLQYIEWS